MKKIRGIFQRKKTWISCKLRKMKKNSHLSKVMFEMRNFRSYFQIVLKNKDKQSWTKMWVFLWLYVPCFVTYIKLLGRDETRAIILERLGLTKVKENYKNMHQSILCEKCNSEEETTIHLIRCQLDEAPAFKNFENILWNI